ncbi:MAG: ABC transporter substrate-binding protein [Saccharolobus sp.]|uniref:ABC transporter substrate-binding protein n=2 Tax=Sulfolobaceae TaxID=118883 RepID=UPI001F111F23|nr:ABC transporter substrate-binding protein [Saccharolobus shibatae]MCH4815788.1 ABC transporter substrate-binding protein [Saccharolobus shibatae]
MVSMRRGISRTLAIVIALVIIIIAVGAGVGYFYNLSSNSSSSTVPITIGTVDYNEHAYLAPLLNGSLSGVFKTYLPFVTIQLFPAGSAAVIHAMETGTVQMGVVVEDNAVTAIAEGAPIVIIATFEPTPINFAIVVSAKSPYYNVTQLEGKSFASSGPGSFDDIVLHILFNEEHWGNNYTEVYVGSVPAQLAAVLTGKVAATAVAPLVQPQVLNTSEFRVVDYIPESWPLWVVVATKSFVEQHPAEVRKVLQVIFMLNKYFDQNIDNASFYFLMAHYHFTPSLATLFLKTDYYSTNGAIYSGGMQLELQFLQKTHVINITNIPPLTDFYTTEFASALPMNDLYYNGSILE